MKKLTKSRTSAYHTTIDWAEPNLSFSQSPSCYIPRMNVGSHVINHIVSISRRYLLDAKPRRETNSTKIYVQGGLPIKGGSLKCYEAFLMMLTVIGQQPMKRNGQI